MEPSGITGHLAVSYFFLFSVILFSSFFLKLFFRQYNFFFSSFEFRFCLSIYSSHWTVLLKNLFLSNSLCVCIYRYLDWLDYLDSRDNCFKTCQQSTANSLWIISSFGHFQLNYLSIITHSHTPVGHHTTFFFFLTGDRFGWRIGVSNCDYAIRSCTTPSNMFSSFLYEIHEGE